MMVLYGFALCLPFRIRHLIKSTLAGPVLTFARPYNSPTAFAGTTVSIFGQNFGASDLSSTVRFSQADGELPAADCKKTVWLADTLVACQMHDAVGLNVTIIHEVVAQQNDKKSLFSFDGSVAALGSQAH